MMMRTLCDIRRAQPEARDFYEGIEFIRYKTFITIHANLLLPLIRSKLFLSQETRFICLLNGIAVGK